MATVDQELFGQLIRQPIAAALATGGEEALAPMAITQYLVKLRVAKSRNPQSSEELCAALVRLVDEALNMRDRVQRLSLLERELT